MENENKKACQFKVGILNNELVLEFGQNVRAIGLNKLQATEFLRTIENAVNKLYSANH